MIRPGYVKKIKHGGFRLFIQTAIRLGVEVQEVFDHPRVLELKYKNETAYCVGDCIPTLRRASNVATKNKAVTKAILSRIGIRTPRGIDAATYKELLEKMHSTALRYPLIAKPLDQAFAHGVTWNIRSRHELQKAILHIQKTSLKPAGKRQHFLVEEMVPGDEYRVLVLKSSVISCVKKIPATVMGDGRLSIKMLIRSFNRTRLPGFKIKVDKTVKRTLKERGLDLDSVLTPGQSLKLRNNMNMSDGGRSIDCTRELSPRLKQVCVSAVAALGMDYGGIDLISTDISLRNAPYAIIEVNALPYFNMNEKPLVEGRGTNVSRLLLRSIFPQLRFREE